MALFKKITELFVKPTTEIVITESKKLPLEIINTNDVTEIKIRGIKIIEHSVVNPFITIERGKFEINTKKDKTSVINNVRKSIPLTKVNQKNTKNSTTLEFFDKGYKVSLIVKEEPTGLLIELDGKQNYEKIKLNFYREETENLIGLGEYKNEIIENGTYNIIKNNNKEETFLSQFFASVKKESSIGETILGRILSTREFLMDINTDSLIQLEVKSNNIVVAFNKFPTNIRFMIAKKFGDIYNTFNYYYPNRQKIDVKFTNGLIISASAKNIEQKLNTYSINNIEVNSVILTETNIEIAKLEEVINKIKDRKVSLIINVAPIVSHETIKQIGTDGVIMQKNNKPFVVTQSVKGVAVDLTSAKGSALIKTYIDKLYSLPEVSGFVARTPFLLSNDIIIEGENTEELNTSWTTKWQELLSQTISKKPNGILFIKNASRFSHQYGVCMTEDKKSTDDIINSITNMSASGMGVVVSEVGGLLGSGYKKSNETQFLDRLRLATLLPIVIIGNVDDSLITLKRDEINKMMSIRGDIKPQILDEIHQCNVGLPLITPYWAGSKIEKEEILIGSKIRLNGTVLKVNKGGYWENQEKED